MAMTRRRDWTVTKLAIVSAMVLIASCHRTEDAFLLSEHFQVCANLPAGTFSYAKKAGPDFDAGELTLNGIAVDVMIGGHPPRVPNSVIDKGLKAIDGFHLLGTDTHNARERVFFGHMRGERSLILVVLSAPDLQPIEAVVMANDFIFECD